MPYGDGFMWGMHWWGWLSGVVFLALLLFLAVRLSTNRSGESSRSSPREILDRRYAAGEISTEEYEERKVRLEGKK